MMAVAAIGSPSYSRVGPDQDGAAHWQSSRHERSQHSSVEKLD